MKSESVGELRDLTQGVPCSDLLPGNIIPGKVGAEPVLLVRTDQSVVAMAALCPHYHAPLAGGLVVGETIRCPMHHACFDLHTGEALRAPSLDPLPLWQVETLGDKLYVRERKPPETQVRRAVHSSAKGPQKIAIIGGGAAGLAAADQLRRRGFDGGLKMLSADQDAPYDRPNLSKDYLAGHAPDDWMPLRPEDYYAKNEIDLMLGKRVSSIDTANRRLQLSDGSTLGYDALLIATGADPVRDTIPGSVNLPVYSLRSFSDARQIGVSGDAGHCAVLVGAGFIGLETAASLRVRGLEVHIVARGSVPMERVLGRQVGGYLLQLHSDNGVQFHMGKTIQEVNGKTVLLSDGSAIKADFIVQGIGVQPSISLAQEAGLAIDRGIRVDQYLQTSAPGIFAAGDVARWPDPHSGQDIRVEHWVVAQRQGQTAARNMLGAQESFDAVPFFWSQHYDLTLNVVGHAEDWDAANLTGSLAARDCAVVYKKAGKVMAIAGVGRDLASLRAELAFENRASCFSRILNPGRGPCSAKQHSDCQKTAEILNTAVSNPVLPSPLPVALGGTRSAITRSKVGRVSWYRDQPNKPTQNERPLLLVHSVNAAASAYEVKPLYDHYRGTRPVYALDLPGFGLSDRSRRPYTPRLMTDAIHAILNQIQAVHGPGPVDAIGLSLGAEFLARAASEAQGAFHSLGFISPTGFDRPELLEGPPGSDRGKPLLYAVISRPALGAWLFRRLTRRAAIAHFLRGAWGSDKIDNGMLDYDFAITRQGDIEHAPLRFLAGYLFSRDIGTVYQSLTQPVWVIHGARGDFVKYIGLRNFRNNPKWSMGVMSTGALPHFEMLPEFLDRYEKWRSRLGAFEYQ